MLKKIGEFSLNCFLFPICFLIYIIIVFLYVLIYFDIYIVYNAEPVTVNIVNWLFK